MRAGAPAAEDELAVEEPLEIRVFGETLAITMRTPGDDAALALGYLLAEGVVKSADDVGSIAHCGHPGDEGWGNILEVTPAPGARLKLERLEPLRRGTVTTSACGVCGRRSVDDLLALAGPVEDGPDLPPGLLRAGAEALGRCQPNFARTGGVHAALVLSAAGDLLASAEDVGRHNAVDKVLGALLREGRLPARRVPGAPALLVVSGRASFEIVQKAIVAKLAAVASVSAASTLAVDLAERANLSLATFVRGSGYVLCAHPERVEQRPMTSP